MNTRIRELAIIVAAIVVAVSPMSAGATTQETYGDVHQSGYDYYSNARRILWDPYGIAFKKTDGPAMSMGWYGCAGSPGVGPDVSIPNPDPTDWIQIGPGHLPYGLKFCLRVRSYGHYATDTFTGYIDWDGDDI